MAQDQIPNSADIVIVGGAVIGTGISVMHYIGMAAYRVDGIVTWTWPVVALSVLLSVGLSAAAFARARQAGRAGALRTMSLLALGVVALHFSGMAAMRESVSPCAAPARP